MTEMLDWREAVDERERFTSDILEKVKRYLTEDEYKHLCFETGIGAKYGDQDKQQRRGF